MAQVKKIQLGKKKSDTVSESSSDSGSEGSSGSSTDVSSTSGSSSVSQKGSVAASPQKKEEEVQGEEKGQVGKFGQSQGSKWDKRVESIAIDLRNGKRLFVDVKENQRGKFLKLALLPGRVAVYQQAMISRITMQLKIAKECVGRLDELLTFLEEMGKDNGEQEEKKEEVKKVGNAPTPRPKPIHSAMISDEGRRYFLDLLPSRFEGREPVLRITMDNRLFGERTVISIESSEVKHLREAMDKMLEKYSEDLDAEQKPQLESHSLRFGRKTFFFDPVAQVRGESIRVTEVFSAANRRMERNSLMVPDKLLARFAAVLLGYDSKLNTGASGEKGGEGDVHDEEMEVQKVDSPVKQEEGTEQK